MFHKMMEKKKCFLNFTCQKKKKQGTLKERLLASAVAVFCEITVYHLFSSMMMFFFLVMGKKRKEKKKKLIIKRVRNQVFFFIFQ